MCPSRSLLYVGNRVDFYYAVHLALLVCGVSALNTMFIKMSNILFNYFH